MSDRQEQGSILAATGWMILLTILLCWLPFVGALVAGLVGGRKAGGLGNAIVAALVPSFLIGGALMFFGTALTGLPVIGVVAGFGGFVLALSCAGPLILGAILGALL